MRALRRSLVAVALPFVSIACGRKAAVGVDAGSPSASASVTDAPSPLAMASPRGAIVLDMLAPSPRCRVEHRGALIDLGTPEAVWNTPGRPDTGGDLASFERDGASWARVLDRTQTFTFAASGEGASLPTLVAARGRGGALTKATAYVDGKVVGTLAFSTGEDKIAVATTSGAPLGPGLHTLMLRWHGVAKKEETLAELDWIRVGNADDDPSAYAPPSRREVEGDVALAGAPRHAYLLRAPSIVRCVTWAPKGASVVADVGALGDGSDGEVEVRVREAGGAARKLGSEVARGARWSTIATPLDVDDAAGAIVVIELAVTRAPKQGRVAIAEPRVVQTQAPERARQPSVPVETAVVVVLAGLDRSRVEGPAFRALAAESVKFVAHRAPSTLAGASVASLLTGLPVPVHALEDPGARLSVRTPLLPRAIAGFGVETAFFSEAPPTGPAFGFAHDWSHYAASSPAEGPPTAFVELDKFLAANVGKKVLIAVHARGAHPPYEIGADALRSLPPEHYAGPIDPKHAAAVIGRARRGLHRLAPADYERIDALTDAALAPQLTSLEATLAKLKEAGRLDRTMVVVTSDVSFALPPPPSSGATPSVPTGATSAAPQRRGAPASSGLPSPSAVAVSPTKPARERFAVAVRDETLAIPLLVRFPQARHAGRTVAAVTDPTDVAATIVAGFGGSIAPLAGRDLESLVSEEDRARATPRLEDDGSGYTLVWGAMRLSGDWRHAPSLLIGGEEVRQQRPFEYMAAWGLTAEERARWLAMRARGPGREPATIDGKTSEALDSWEKSR
jgi:hypothetical protein